MHQWAYQVESLQQIKEKKTSTVILGWWKLMTSGVFIHSKDLTQQVIYRGGQQVKTKELNMPKIIWNWT